MRLTKYWKYTKILMKIDDEEYIFSLLLFFCKKFKSLLYLFLTFYYESVWNFFFYDLKQIFHFISVLAFTISIFI